EEGAVALEDAGKQGVGGEQRRVEVRCVRGAARLVEQVRQGAGEGQVVRGGGAGGEQRHHGGVRAGGRAPVRVRGAAEERGAPGGVGGVPCGLLQVGGEVRVPRLALEQRLEQGLRLRVARHLRQRGAGGRLGLVRGRQGVRVQARQRQVERRARGAA